MIEYITPQRIANSILQKADSFNSFLVVEGKSDFNLFNKFVSKAECKIEIAFGNSKVIEVIEELNKRNFERSLGIIDLDFNKLEGNTCITSNVIETDFHDIEIMIINSDSFETVLSHYAKSEKIEQHYGSITAFKQHLFELTKHIGFVKWLNHKKNLGLKFKPTKPEGNPLDFTNFISINDLKFLGYEKLVESILNYCNGKVKVEIKKEELIRELKDFIEECDLNHLCNGHDLMHVISISLRKNISNLNSKSVSDEQLAKEFLLSYEARYFVNTDLYKKIKGWEELKKVTILSF